MSSLYKKRGIFYYQGKDEDGNRIQRSLRTEDREEAEEKKAKLDERFSADTPSTLTKLVEDYLERRHRKVERDELSGRTLDSDEYALSFFSEWVEEEYGTLHSDELEKIDFSAFKQSRLEDGVSPTTAGQNLRHTQTFFSHLRRKGVIEKDLFQRVEIPQPRSRKVVPNEREFAALKEWLDKQIEQADEPSWVHLLMKLACHTGMRMGEMARIKWERGPEDFGTGHARKYVYLDAEEKNLTIKFKGKLRRIPVEHIWGVFEEMLGRREPLCLHFPSDGEPLQSLFALREVEGRGGKGGCALPSLHLPLHSSRRRYSLAPPGRSRLQGRQNRRAPLGKNTERPSRLSPDGLENVRKERGTQSTASHSRGIARRGTRTPSSSVRS